MKPDLIDQANVRPTCPDCAGALVTFEHRSASNEYGSIIQPRQGTRIHYRLLRCAGCGRGGLAGIEINSGGTAVGLVEFFPRTIDVVNVPQDVPPDVLAEFREAELTASVGAWRAASAMLRSTLEKTLKHNGYLKGSLADKIDQAAEDVITAARSKRAHEDIRVLGNDILHDARRAVFQAEFDLAHKYA